MQSVLTTYLHVSPSPSPPKPPQHTMLKLTHFRPAVPRTRSSQATALCRGPCRRQAHRALTPTPPRCRTDARVGRRPHPCRPTPTRTRPACPRPTPRRPWALTFRRRPEPITHPRRSHCTHSHRRAPTLRRPSPPTLPHPNHPTLSHSLRTPPWTCSPRTSHKLPATHLTSLPQAAPPLAARPLAVRRARTR
jgi:hypothetical protein